MSPPTDYRSVAKFCDAVDRLIAEGGDDLEAFHNLRIDISTGGTSPTGFEHLMGLLFDPDIDEHTRQRVQATLDRLPKRSRTL